MNFSNFTSENSYMAKKEICLMHEFLFLYSYSKINERGCHSGLWLLNQLFKCKLINLNSHSHVQWQGSCEPGETEQTFRTSPSCWRSGRAWFPVVAGGELFVTEQHPPQVAGRPSAPTQSVSPTTENACWW